MTICQSCGASPADDEGHEDFCDQPAELAPLNVLVENVVGAADDRLTPAKELEVSGAGEMKYTPSREILLRPGVGTKALANIRDRELAHISAQVAKMTRAIACIRQAPTRRAAEPYIRDLEVAIQQLERRDAGDVANSLFQFPPNIGVVL